MGVVAFAVFGLPSFMADRPAPPPPISVEFVRIAEETQVAEPEPEVEQSRAVRTEPVTAREEAAPAPSSEAAPLPKPAEKLADAVTPKVKPEISENRQLAQSITPQNKPKPPSRLKKDRLAALIDKSIKDDEEPAPVEKAEDEPKEPEKADPFSGLRGRVALASLRDALSQKLNGCWRFPSGAKGVETMRTTVRIWLRPDGTLSRQPELLDGKIGNDAFFNTFLEEARRAVIRCEPYEEAKDFIAAGNAYIDFSFDGAFLGGR